MLGWHILFVTKKRFKEKIKLHKNFWNVRNVIITQLKKKLTNIKQVATDESSYQQIRHFLWQRPESKLICTVAVRFGRGHGEPDSGCVHACMHACMCKQHLIRRQRGVDGKRSIRGKDTEKLACLWFRQKQVESFSSKLQGNFTFTHILHTAPVNNVDSPFEDAEFKSFVRRRLCAFLTVQLSSFANFTNECLDLYSSLSSLSLMASLAGLNDGLTD